MVRRRGKRYRLPKDVFNSVVKRKRPKGELKRHWGEILLTDEDKITYVYKADEVRAVWEIVSVSYNVRIDDSWETVVYYDTFHEGMLHMHLRKSMVQDVDVVTPKIISKTGTQEKKLTWTVEYLKKNYLDFKRGFLRRSKLL